jgi:hypothetical protein
MRTLIGTTVAMLVLAGPAWSQKMSQSEISACNTAWTKLEGNKAGSVSQVQAQSAVKDLSSADTNRDGKLTKVSSPKPAEKVWSLRQSSGLNRRSSASV